MRGQVWSGELVGLGAELVGDLLGLVEDAENVASEDFLDVGVGVALADEGFGDFGELGDVFHAVGHGGAVEVGAQADVIGSDEFDDVVDVLDDFFPTDARQFAFCLQFLELALLGPADADEIVAAFFLEGFVGFGEVAGSGCVGHAILIA